MGPKKKIKLTRVQASETLFGGGPQDLLDTSIPTYRDIARYFYFIESTEEKSDTAYASRKFGEKLVLAWGKVSDRLPLFAQNSYERKIQRYLDDLKEIRRNRAKRSAKEDREKKLDTIFDICRCSCGLEEANCDHKDVKCEAENCQQTRLCVCERQVNIMCISLSKIFLPVFFQIGINT